MPLSSIYIPLSIAHTHRPRSSTLRPRSGGHGIHSSFSLVAVPGGHIQLPKWSRIYPFSMGQTATEIEKSFLRKSVN